MWIAVDKKGFEKCFHYKPYRTSGEYWKDEKTYDEIRGMTTCADDYSMVFPKGTIEKIIGRKMTWEDDPIELEFNYYNF